MASAPGPQAGPPKAGGRAPKPDKNLRLLFHRNVFHSTIPLASGPNGDPYYYQGGYYRPGAKIMARRWLMDTLQGTPDASLWGPAAEAYMDSFVQTEASRWPLAPWPPGMINVQNGWLARVPDGESGQEPGLPPIHRIGAAQWRLFSHTAGIRSQNQLPVTFDPAQSCPRIEEFMRRMLGDEAKSFIAQVSAWFLSPHNPSQKAILLLGQAGNGKSTFMNILGRFLGEANYSIDSLHSLSGNRFALAQVYGKLAHMCPDLPKDKLPGMEVLKQLTGDDPIGMEAKWRDRAYFRSQAKLIFSCNGAPSADGADRAFWDRWHIVPCLSRLRGTAAQRGMASLLDEICTPGELSGLLNLALAEAPHVWEQGVDIPPAHKAIVELCAKMQSVTDRWALDSFYPDPDKQVEPGNFTSSFRLWCRRRMESPEGCSPHDLVTAALQVGGRLEGNAIKGLDWIVNRSLILDDGFLDSLHGHLPGEYPN